MRFALHPALAPYVTWMQGYHLSGYRPGVHIGVPGAEITCVFDLSGPLRITSVDGSASRYDVTLSGIYLAPVGIHHDGSQHGVMLSLTPLGVRALFGVPAAAIAEDCVSLEDAIGIASDDLIDRMRAAPGWSCLEVLHAELLRRVPPTPPDGVGLEAWNLLQQSDFRTLSAVASYSGWSERHLRGSIRSELGQSAGALRRLLRFQRSVHIARPGNLASVAAECGYADQAHLTREWRRFLGMTPTEYLTREEFVPAD